MAVHSGVVALARAGYAARGAVYLILAGFAVASALGSKRTVGTKGAVRSLLDEPYGEALIWALAIGLVAYALWRWAQSLADTDRRGNDAKALAVRAGIFGSGVANLLLAVFAIGLVSSVDTGGGSGAGKESADALARLLGFDGSRWLVYAVAAVPLVVGIAHFVKAWRYDFERWFECGEDKMRWVRPVSRIGLCARGVVFVVIALLMFVGGSRYDPAKPPGVDDALEALRALPFGTWLLLAIGLGLVAFAVYSFMQALWRRIDLSRLH